MEERGEDWTHHFLVELWTEPRRIQGARPLVRGRVRHLGSGAQRAVKTTDEVISFIERWLPMARGDGEPE